VQNWSKASMLPTSVEGAPRKVSSCKIPKISIQ
jgi:hypothetical protein